MGEARKTIGRMIDALQETNRLLGGIEGHAETLKGLQQDLQADHQALKEIGFEALPATFAAAFGEQLEYLGLAQESLAAALNVSYGDELAAKTKAAKNNVVPLPSSGDPPLESVAPVGPEETVAGCGDGGVTAAPPKKRNRVKPSVKEVEAAERYGVHPLSWMRLDRADRGRIATRWKRGDRGAALTYGVMIPEPLVAVA